jgi:hypothetical protein
MKTVTIIIFNFILLSSTLFAQTKNSEETHVLFIGNSLTYTNDLPKKVQKLAKADKIKLSVNSIAKPDYALIDHWQDGDIQKLISSNKYSIVIVQQGPSSQEEGRKYLLDYGTMINEICAAHNCKLAYYMVWPALPNYNTFDGVIKSYTLAAEATDALLFPVGLLWKAELEKNKNAQLYGSDLFHPSEKGTMLAAEIIWKGIKEFLKK